MNEKAEEVTTRAAEDEKARSNFLFVFNYLAQKYNISYLKDVDIDFEKMIINVKTEMANHDLLAFISELEKITGHLK